MFKKIREWFGIQIIKKPRKMVLGAILLFNVIFILLSAAIVSALSLKETENMNFLEAAFCTITMILDAGCISYVVSEIGHSGVAITLVCLLIVFVGMIAFTGATIGYVTNYISSFIENANSGKRKINLSNHFVLINWNSRASEIVNDMLYSETKQTVVVLVPSRKEEIEKEIEERLAETISKENHAVEKKYAHLPFIARKIAIKKNKLKKKLTVLIKEGDIFSSKQLKDISIDKARSIVILQGDFNNSSCKYEKAERNAEFDKGNSLIIKTLMQVADLTAAETSFDNQRIIVEVSDLWTLDVVNKIIEAKQVDGKCHIIPVRINLLLGQILSQFCIMPELNTVYSELFSNKGSQFFVEEADKDCEETAFIEDYLKEHNSALPIAIRQDEGKTFKYYLGESIKDLVKKSTVRSNDYTVELKKNYWLEKRNVIILGHNSKSKFIMEGFKSFSNEWKTDSDEIVDILVLDNKDNLEKANYYRDYPFVTKTIEADVYNRELLNDTIERYVHEHKGDISILILSDDMASNDRLDAEALSNLVYVRNIIDRNTKENPDFDAKKVDVIVEIINPKHYDIVNSYSFKNVVISNRYISKMVTQISEKEALYDFYNDILSYDEGDFSEYSSKEVYIKKVWRYFEEVPAPTTADQFVRAVYNESIKEDKYGMVNPTIAIGYVDAKGKVKIFSGDLTQIPVALTEKDKVILISCH